MQDGADSVMEPLEDVDLSDDPNIKKPISISTQLSPKEKGHRLIKAKRRCLCLEVQRDAHIGSNNGVSHLKYLARSETCKAS